MRGRHVQTAPYPMSLRQETVAEFERLLYITPKYDPHSSAEYTIKYDNNDRTLFTVTGKKHTERPVREFRDASGLPMFECQRPWPAWRWGKPWRVRLPGSEDADLVDIKMKGISNNFDLTFRNALAKDAKTEDDKTVKVEVRQESLAFFKFSASVDRRKVVDVRESVEKNRTIYSWAARSAGAPRVPWRSFVDVYVAEGFDFALASLIAVIVCDLYFTSIPPTAMELKERDRRLNPQMG